MEKLPIFGLAEFECLIHNVSKTGRGGGPLSKFFILIWKKNSWLL